MPNFNLQNMGTWFYFYPEDESQGGVCLRELTPEESNRIEKLTVKKKKKFKRGIPYEDVQEDKRLADKLRWDYCITDWKNVQIDGNENDAECTAENKLKLMDKNPDFIKIVADSLIGLTEANKVLEEAQLKNSESSSNGSTKEDSIVTPV